MNAQRSLRNGEREVRKLIDDASIAGYDVIELLYNKARPSIRNLVGFKVPKIRAFNRGPSVDTTQVDVKFVEGSVNFYPDGRNFCYGYVIDIPENRLKIAAALKTGWYRVTDTKIRNEIEQLAEEMGWPTTPILKPTLNYKKPKAQEDAEKEAERWRRKAEELEQKFLEAKETGEIQFKKPLEGVHVKRRGRPPKEENVNKIGSAVDSNEPLTDDEKEVLKNAD